jgi:hypothetical protein
MECFCTITSNIGALSNGTRALYKVPAGYGGMTFIAGNVVGYSAGTSALSIADLGTAGTLLAANAGTLATLGSAVYASGVAKAFTAASTVYVAEGHWIGVVEDNVGAAPTITQVNLTFIHGK